jgi:HEAT repeat protein
MKRQAFCLSVLVAALLPLAGTLNAAEPDRPSDEQLLRSAGLGTDGPALLDLFRKRTQATADREQIRSLVAQLSDESPAKREKAGAELIALGMAAVPYLREASRNVDDRELLARTRRCLDFIDGPTSVPLVLSATRLLAQRRPEGAVEALLQFLPMAESDGVLDQLRQTLPELGLGDGKPEPALLAALDDKLSVRRAVAAEALAQLGRQRPEARLRQLLKDPVPSVRLRVALALAPGQDKDAVVELIQLLGELPTPQAKLAEDYLLELAQEQAPQVPLGNDEATRKKARDAWAAWWKAGEADGLLEEFRKRTLPEAERDKVLALIRKLGDDSFDEREKATTALSALGGKVAPLLRQALASPDLEIRKRAGRCLLAAEAAKDRLPPLSPVSARLVALHKPAGAVEVLLAYLGSEDDDSTLQDVQTALAALALRDGKADPSLVKSLEDTNGRRRAAAAVALASAGAGEQLPAIRKLLRDEDRHVRLETALALAGAAEKDAVPVLLALLAELPPPQSLRIEEYLCYIAGDKGPTTPVGTDEKERKRCSEAWAAWWQENEKTITLVAVNRQAPRGLLGYTLIALPDLGQVLELGADGKVRWQINGINGPFAAQVLSRDRVLVAETRNGRVSERNTRGDVLWEKRCDSPVGCQRLANGNTFIVTPSALVEVDRKGQETFSRPLRPGEGPNFVAGLRMRDGRIVCATSQPFCLFLDGSGEEIRKFPLPGENNFNCVEVLSNGRILVARQFDNKVTEYDLEGHAAWEASVPQPAHAFRLPNGNTLVGVQSPGRVLELDRTGKQVWEYPAPNQTRVGDVKRR